jgi:hypothetical protein
MKKLFTLLSSLAIGLLTTQAVNGQPSGRAASIEGDVYLLNKLGEVKKGAAGTVGLAVPGPRLEAIFRSACAAQKTERRRDTIPMGGTNQGGFDSLAIAKLGFRNPAGYTFKGDDSEVMMAQAKAKMARLIELENNQREQMFATLIAASANAPTGMNAHFKFAKVPPGTYFLLSVMHLGELTYGWVVPVSVKSGQSMRVDLDNNNAQLITFYLSSETGEAPHTDHNPLFCGPDGLGREFPLH